MIVLGERDERGRGKRGEEGIHKRITHK